jgi:outer membrane receptor protein involved in Fe transport
MIRSGVPFSVVLALLVSIAPVWAGTTGKIAGTVIDAQTGEPLVPANIILEGTVLGGVSTDSGEYFIINVPSGTYTIVGKMIGYQDVRKQNVRVFPDFTTTVDFEMQQTAFELGEAIEVVEERPLIQPDRTGSASFITAEEIGILPIRGYKSATAVQSGVVDFGQDLGLLDNSTEESRNGSTLIVRGGRPNQVGYFVDGFLQQDPLTGISSTSINSNAIEEIVFQKGGFEPEYGRFQSGIVNVITKEGGDRFFGSVDLITDNMSGDWINTVKNDYNIYAATLGGPMFGDNTFFLSGERRWMRDRDPSAAMEESAEMGREVLNQGDEPTEAEQGALTAIENNIQPQNTLDGWNWQGKLRFRLGSKSSLMMGTQGSLDKWRQYIHSYLFDNHHAPRYEDRNYSGFARYTNNLSPSTFFNASFNYFYTERKRGDGDHFTALTRYARPGGNPRFDLFSNLFWNVDDPDTPTITNERNVILEGNEDHVWDDYLRRISSYWGVAFDMTKQANQYNQLKFGGDFRRHTLRRYNHFFPVRLYGAELEFVNVNDVDRYGFDTAAVEEEFEAENYGDTLDNTKNPIEFSLFLQDKIEYEGLVVKAGLRYDYYDTDTKAVYDTQRPLDGQPDAEGAVPGNLDETDLTDNEVYHRVSPRIGVAFPVSSSTNIHFNFGQFFQPPTLENLYVSYRFLEHKTQTGGYFVDFGNPNLRPEQTTAYEAGISQALGDNSKIELTTYYKSTKDLIQVRNITSLSATTKAYASYLNTDFGTIKGVDVDFTLRRTARWTVGFYYGLAYANGTGSLPGTQRQTAWTAADPPKQTFALDFDQRHKLSLNLDYRFADGDGPAWGGTRILENAGVNMLCSVTSGTPYTPIEIINEVTLAAIPNTTPLGPVNSRYNPWTFRVDMKVDKGFRLGPVDFQAYVWVLNLLNRNNVQQVYRSSGSATTTRFLTTETGYNTVAESQPALSNADPVDFYRFKELDPRNFSMPRIVRWGLKMDF